MSAEMNVAGDAAALARKLGVRELPMAAMATTEPPPRDYLFGQWALTAGVYAVMFAPGGAGKTYAAMESMVTLALAGAADCSYDPLGLRPKAIPGGWKVCYVTGEDPDNEMWRRVYRLADGIGPAGYTALEKNMRVLSTQGAPTRVLITDPDFQQLLIGHAQGARLIVLDTLARFHAADESSSDEMAAVIGAIEYVARQTGAAVLALHHCAKSIVLDGGGALQQAARGSTVIVDHARWALALTGSTSAEVTTLVEAKHNYGRGSSPIYAMWATGTGGMLGRCDDPQTPRQARGGRTGAAGKGGQYKGWMHNNNSQEASNEDW